MLPELGIFILISKLWGKVQAENELVYNLVNGLRPEFGVMRTIILTGGVKL